MFGGELFRKLREAGEDAFLKLPPPVPSNLEVVRAAAATWGGGGGGRCNFAAAAPVQNMRQYYNCSGGCITHNSLVALADGSLIPASSVRRGMCLLRHPLFALPSEQTTAPNHEEEAHEDEMAVVVKCVAKIRVPGSEGISLVRFPQCPSLAVTEYHPVRFHSNKEGSPTPTWTFPVNTTGGRATLEHGHEFVYTFLLEGGSAILVDGKVEVVALGHGLHDNDVVQHEYLGSEKVVRDLEQLPGFAETGEVVVEGFTRDEETKRVNGILRKAVLGI